MDLSGLESADVIDTKDVRAAPIRIVWDHLVWFPPEVVSRIVPEAETLSGSPVFHQPIRPRSRLLRHSLIGRRPSLVPLPSWRQTFEASDEKWADQVFRMPLARVAMEAGNVFRSGPASSGRSSAMRSSRRTSANCEPSLTSTVRAIRSKRMEWMRNKPQKRRLKLIVANDGRGGLDGCDGD
jgi:hypothetical protein